MRISEAEHVDTNAFGVMLQADSNLAAVPMSAWPRSQQKSSKIVSLGAPLLPSGRDTGGAARFELENARKLPDSREFFTEDRLRGISEVWVPDVKRVGTDGENPIHDHGLRGDDMFFDHDQLHDFIGVEAIGIRGKFLIDISNIQTIGCDPATVKRQTSVCGTGRAKLSWSRPAWPA